ncbi:endoglucanase [Carboxylicivirga sp. A043]|uniref:SGNH/GDSL hydrolase family protein n=1 Tax=Carboxylicivirga litoralis TaxID=2816963 RepID=UPI0021CAF0CB|nr:SGNH/GDSL hydrolase family protein [Carboxylicivirga sp. A043]MCU4156156.1 endoglucanase [Carboxylicivirga sp. A043]
MKYSLSLLMVCMCLSALGQMKPVKASDAVFTYSGRIDKRNPDAVRYDWPGVSVCFQFTGNQLAFVMDGGATNYFNVFIDGRLHEVLMAPADSVYNIKGIKGRGWHTCCLQKRTEGEQGTVTFKGVRLAAKAEVKSCEKLPARRIEFIGNSLTAGYGTEGQSGDEKFLPATENVDKSYAFITARAFNAECYVTAHSGLGVVRNYAGKPMATLTDRYRQTFDMDTSLIWNFNDWQPHAVVINLGSNDYSANGAPSKALFIDRYKRFLQEIRSYYGDVPVFCIVGPIRDEPLFSNVKQAVEEARVIYNDHHLYFIAIPPALLNRNTDYGSDWHPSYKGQLKMANHIIPTIANVLDWDYSMEECK